LIVQYDPTLLEDLELVNAPFADLCCTQYRKRSLFDHADRSWREEEGVPVYFTIDAGPNVHLICEADSADEVERRVGALSAVERVLTSGPGTGPQLLDGHLF